MIEIVSTSLDHTVTLGRCLGELCVPGDVIALDGELGAGKTQLVRGLAIGLGLDPAHVSSPTFVFMHEYTPEPPPPEEQGHYSAGQNDDGSILVHIDAYRLTGPDDLATLGFDDELRDTSVTAVEWATLIESMPGQPLGEHRLSIRLEHTRHDGQTDTGSRNLTLEPHGRWTHRLPRLQNLAPGQ